MAISSARRVAFDVLRRVAAEDAYAADLLYAEIEPGTKKTDASLATDCGLILMNPGKKNRVAEARAHADFCGQLGIPVLGEIRAPGVTESGDIVDHRVSPSRHRGTANVCEAPPEVGESIAT